jgi:hypothetical protein
MSSSSSTTQLLIFGAVVSIIVVAVVWSMWDSKPREGFYTHTPTPTPTPPPKPPTAAQRVAAKILADKKKIDDYTKDETMPDADAQKAAAAVAESASALLTKVKTCPGSSMVGTGDCSITSLAKLIRK